MAYGLSIVEIANDSGTGWKLTPHSPYNRRITAQTVIELSGLVAGDDLRRDGEHARE